MIRHMLIALRDFIVLALFFLAVMIWAGWKIGIIN